jgi:hypothetical protein
MPPVESSEAAAPASSAVEKARRLIMVSIPSFEVSLEVRCGGPIVTAKDGSRQFRLARAIHSGQVFINNYGAGGGIELPFGGVKRSGHGREKGFEALYGFATTKTISIYHG